MSFFQIYDDFNKLVNELYKFNSSDLIYINEYNLPVSNKYYLTIVNNSDPASKFKDFFEYAFDKTRTIEKNFIVGPEIDIKVDWDYEQFYMLTLGEKNLLLLDNEIAELTDVITESNTQLTLIIDINYLINFINKFKQNNQQIHIYDWILHKLNNCPIKNVMIYDETNTYKANNLLYKQIESVLNKNLDFNFEEKIILIKNIDDQEDNLYWNIIKEADTEIEFIKEIKSESSIDETEVYYYGKILNKEFYICKTIISNLIKKNIFELNDNPGIVLDPIDKIKYLI